MGTCPFCNWRNDPTLKERVFYSDPEWFAFLSAPCHTRGHAIVAAQPQGIHCPNEIEQMPDSLGWVIKQLTLALLKYYREESADFLKDMLLVSLRGDIQHFHIHLIPLWQEEELRWRLETRHKRGRLMTFLGYLEARDVEQCREERMSRGLSESEQREEITKDLQEDVGKLREITGFNPDG